MSKLEEMMAPMPGIKIVVSDNAVYCSLNGVAVTIGYKFTGGDVAKSIRMAVEKMSCEK